MQGCHQDASDAVVAQQQPHAATVLQHDLQKTEQHQHPDYVFTNEKAGMAGVDKDKIKKIVYEMSKVRHSHVFASQLW
jgi:hypothetical protein